MITMCTPFDEKSVDLICQMGFDLIKVASCSAKDWPLLSKVTKSNLPIVISTGGLTISETDDIVSFFEHKGCDFAIMHCVSIYPTPNEKCNLNQIDVLKERYKSIPIGWSTHEDPNNYDISKSSNFLTLGGEQTFSKGRFLLTEKENGGDILPNDTDEIFFEFYDQLVPGPIPTLLDRKSEQDIRLVSYNTLNEGILDPNRQSHFRRIIQALDPDIIALQEHSEWGSIEDIIQSWFPNDDWNASWTYGDLVVLSNFSIISHTQLSSDRSMAVLIETVDRIGKNLLVFNSHLSCCSNDEDRQDQVDSFTSDWREWRLNNTVPFEIEENTPFIHVGDFNFVGYRKQVETIRLGNIDNENDLIIAKKKISLKF